jgi:hypothetical protein
VGNLTIDSLLPHLPANAKQLQSKFPEFPVGILTSLLKAGQQTGVCTWDSLSNRWKLAPAAPGLARRCNVCGDKYVPTSNAQKHCDRHAERRWKDPTVPKPPPKPSVSDKPRQCAKCGADFKPTGNRQKYCPEHVWRPATKPETEVNAAAAAFAGKSRKQLPELPAQLPEKLPEKVPELNTQPAPSASSAGYPSLEVAPRRGLLCRVVEGEYVIERPGGLSLSLTADEAGLLFGWIGACINRNTTTGA